MIEDTRFAASIFLTSRKARALTTIFPTHFSRSATGTVIRQIALTGILITLLGSCATTKKVAEADDADQADTAAAAVDMLARGGTATTGAQSAYVDPMVTAAHGRKIPQKGTQVMGMRTIAGGTPTHNALTQTYSPLQASIAGAVTEPTGVRAGNTSIFSGHAQAAGPEMAATMTTGSTALDSPYPAARAMPAGGVNAMTRSVFSTGTPVACGNDANGNMISC